MPAYIAEQLIARVKSLAQHSLAIALAVVVVFAALGGLLLATVLKLLRILLPWLVLAGTAAFCWRTGLLNQCWQWLMSFAW